MIKTFKCGDTQALFLGKRVARFANISGAAMRKLQLIDAAATVEFLRVPPGNRLESLKGDRRGQYSVRINDQFRICFRFSGAHAYDVEIVDYH